LDNRLLLAFVVVSEEKSFTRAAERLRVSQPRISLLIRKLEKMLGFDLFRRTSRHVELTEHGNIFLPAALAVCAADDAAERLARSLREEERMRVRFGAPFYTATIPERVRIVDEYLSRAPTAKLEIHNGLTPSMIRQLHEGELLILPNAWDAGSARLIESRGAKAIATTSAGLAWSNGYPDGDALPVDRLVAAVRSIARVIGVPLTADIEGGYSDDPAAVSKVVAAILDAGAVGINIEDGSSPPDLLCAKIAAARQSAEREP